jgi:preprotein translocase subunit SecG
MDCDGQRLFFCMLFMVISTSKPNLDLRVFESRASLIPMEILAEYLPYIQIVLSILLVTGVLLQQSSSGLGGAFGDNFSAGFHTRRGFEKTLFNGTLIIALLFIASAVANILIK